MPSLHYTVAMSQPGTHTFEVQVEARGVAAMGTLRFHLPVWTPGSYSIEDYARHVSRLSAEAEGRPLTITKLDKSTWEIENPGADTVRLRYDVYADKLAVDEGQLNDRHAFFNGTLLFMYLEDAKGEPCTLTVRPAPGWRVVTGLPAVPGELFTFRAADYDELLDAPVECGTAPTYEFEVDGVGHTLLLDGHGNEDVDRLLRDLRSMVQEASHLMGGLPYAHYTFIVHLTERRGGGLEHRNSTAINVGRFQFREPKEYANVLTLFAHEFFHLWNVKRIRPEALGPFDYQRENYTRLLWAMEGITDYYAPLLVGRAGIVPRDRFLDYFAETIRRLEAVPGRRLQSAAASSFDTWIHFYRPDEQTANTGISYYTKGALLGLALDVRLRRASRNQRSLDDVMRLLWERYGAPGIGVPEIQGWQAVAEEVAGESLDDFFARYVIGTEEMEWADTLDYLGLTLERRAATEKESKAEQSKAEQTKAEPSAGPAKTEQATVDPRWAEWRQSAVQSWLGLETRLSDGALLVKSVRADGPSYGVGLSAGDEIIAVNGFRVRNDDDLSARVQDHHPGENVQLAVFHDGELRAFTVLLRERQPNKYTLKPVAAPGESQRANFSDWLHGALTLDAPAD